jgi:lysozyme|tara:strand:- start:225 stop:689 length:465 start_codon:yes stop_codon:yes gene_type:complete
MNIAKIADQLKRHEGVRLAVYDDATGKPIHAGDTLKGHPTIGVGRLLTDARGLTTAEIEMLLANDIDVVIDELNREVPWWNEMNEARQAVMINLCFNLGWPRLSGFKNMLAACEKGLYEKAADEMQDSNWYDQVGLRGVELVDQMRTGRFDDLD